MTYQQKYRRKLCDKRALSQRATKPLAEIKLLWAKALTGKLTMNYRG